MGPQRNRHRQRPACSLVLLAILLLCTVTLRAQPTEDRPLGPYQHTVPAQLNNYAISHWLEQRQDPQTALILLDRAVRIAPNQVELRQNRDRLVDAIKAGKPLPLPIVARPEQTSTDSTQGLNANHPTDEAPAPGLPQRWDEIPQAPAQPNTPEGPRTNPNQTGMGK